MPEFTATISRGDRLPHGDRNNVVVIVDEARNVQRRIDYLSAAQASPSQAVALLDTELRGAGWAVCPGAQAEYDLGDAASIEFARIAVQHKGEPVVGDGMPIVEITGRRVRFVSGDEGVVQAAYGSRQSGASDLDVQLDDGRVWVDVDPADVLVLPYGARPPRPGATPQQTEAFLAGVRQAVRALDVARSHVSHDPDLATLVDGEFESLRKILDADL